jgi:hypothetical protein
MRGYMRAEKDHQGEFAVLRAVVGGARSAAPTDLERECPELSAAEFRGLLKPPNETDPTTSARRRVRITRALLALVLLALAGLAGFLAGSRKEEGPPEPPSSPACSAKSAAAPCGSRIARLTSSRGCVRRAADR